MFKVLVVMSREYQTQIKSKAFVISVVLLPVLMVGSIGLQALTRDRVDTKDRKIVMLDHTHRLGQDISAMAQQYNTTGVLDSRGVQIHPRFLLETVEVGGDLENQRLTLSDRVRRRELAGFVEVGPEVLSGNLEDRQARVRYYSNSPTDREFPRWLQRSLNQIVQARRLQEANVSEEAVRKATQPVPLDDLGLLRRNEMGRIIEAESSDRAAAFLAPFGMMMLMFMGVMVGATPLLQAIVEEKMLRIAEVLLGSVPPFQLMLGKLLGVVGVSLTMIGIYLVGGYGVLHYFERTDLIPLAQIGWVLAYAALAILMFGSLFCAIGASCSEIKDAQSLMAPVTILIVLPMFFLQTVVRAPSGSLATALSFIPPCTPMLMIVRMGIPPGIPLWQPIAGMAGVLVFTVVCVFAAARIFRIGILMQGKPPRVTELIRWAVRG